MAEVRVQKCLRCDNSWIDSWPDLVNWDCSCYRRPNDREHWDPFHRLSGHMPVGYLLVDVEW
jgi:hypothetical protein